MQSPTNVQNLDDKLGMQTARTEAPNLPRVSNDRGVPYTSMADDKENNVTVQTESKNRTPVVGVARDTALL